MGTSATEGTGGAAGQSGGAAGGSAAGSGASGAAGAGAQGGAGGQPGSGEGSGKPALDRTKLSPALQNLSEEQINSVVDTMFSALASRSSGSVDDGAGGGGSPPPSSGTPEPPAEPDYKELFDPQSDKFNPKGAVADIVARNYGKLIGDISTRATTGQFMRFREEYPDFKDFEGDIQSTLKKSGAINPTDEQIIGVYYAAKGMRQTQRERQDRATASQRGTPPGPADTRDERPKQRSLDEDEKAVARRMFSHKEDPEKAYLEYAEKLEKGDTTMKVPLSSGVRR